MKLLVTGGLGFIGSNFCRYMLETHPQYELINVDKIGIGANPTNLRDIENNKNYTFIKGDICNPQLINRVIRLVDTVINFAAETHVDRSINDPNTFIQNNTLGTFTLLEAIRRHNPKARLIQISTDEVYGETLKETLTENSTLKPSNPYAASKAASDMYVLAYHKTYNINTSITRCTNNFGPYQMIEKLIPKTIILAIHDLPIPIYGSGENTRDWIYVQDHCSAIANTIEKGTAGEIYNISTGNKITNINLVKKILTQLDKPKNLITHIENRPGHDTHYSIDSTHTQKTLNWKPTHNFETSLKTTIQWYIENKQWWTPFITNTRLLHPTPWKPHTNNLLL